MGIYRKKPVVIEAFQWTADEKQQEDPMWIVNAIKRGDVGFINEGHSDVRISIKTMEGTMTAPRGSYIIKGVEGEIYPCDEAIFHKTYEKV